MYIRATANTTEENSGVSRRSGLLCSHSHWEYIAIEGEIVRGSLFASWTIHSVQFIRKVHPLKGYLWNNHLKSTWVMNMHSMRFTWIVNPLIRRLFMEESPRFRTIHGGGSTPIAGNIARLSICVMTTCPILGVPVRRMLTIYIS